MSGTRIMVFQLKELIRTGIFALIGIILIVMLIVFLIPKDKSEMSKDYVPGTYSAQIILHSQPIDVEVTVSDSEILGVQLKNMKSEQEVFYPLFKPTLETLSKQIVKYQTTKIATSSEVPVTSKILLDAVNSALSQAVAH